ncbi:hypothetical protein, partial [Enterobacter kobei]|uniref:hypothetical protein n=1 Tax=Enterobacter kobei TaxID=208224 RepID=UPI002004ED5A
KMPAFEWVHVQLHQQKGMISLSPPTICNSANHLLPPACLTTKQSNRQFELGHKSNLNQQSVPPQDDR